MYTVWMSISNFVIPQLRNMQNMAVEEDCKRSPVPEDYGTDSSPPLTMIFQLNKREERERDA